MSAWVSEIDRIVSHVREAIQQLGIVPIRHQRIRADEASQYPIVIPRAIVHQPGVGVKFLAGESEVSVQAAAGGAGAAKRKVGLSAHLVPAGVAGDTGGTQACPERAKRVEGWSPWR